MATERRPPRARRAIRVGTPTRYMVISELPVGRLTVKLVRDGYVADQRSELALDGVQPRPVDRRVDELDLRRQATSLPRLERLIEGRRAVRIELVAHETDGSWLNAVEVELSVFTVQCVGRPGGSGAARQRRQWRLFCGLS